MDNAFYSGTFDIPTFIRVGEVQCDFDITVSYEYQGFDNQAQDSVFTVQPTGIKNIRIPKGYAMKESSLREYLTLFWKEYQDTVEQKARQTIERMFDKSIQEAPRPYDYKNEADLDG